MKKKTTKKKAPTWVVDPPIPCDPNLFGLLFAAATRYHLGRMSYAVSEFCTALTANWKNIPPMWRTVIARDVNQEFVRDDAARQTRSTYTLDGTAWPYPLGWDCDREEWEKVKKLYKETI